VGIASAVAGTVGPDELIRRADVAMYRAKEAGKGQVRVWSPEMHPAQVARAPRREEIAEALEAGELVAHFQPIVSLASGVVVAAEALARWEHPRHGLLGPATFVPAAEATGQVVAIDRVVLEAACVAAAAWDGRDGRPPAGAAVHANLSGVGLRSFEIAAEVEAVLASSGLDPSRLVLEITESVLIGDGDVPMAVRTLNALRDLGVRIALDDFGTGHSSLQSLRELPVDIIKVAKPFVDGAARTPHDRALMRMMVDLGALFGIDVVAEGIEREDQLAGAARARLRDGPGLPARAPRRAPERTEGAACGSLQRMSRLNANDGDFEYDAEDPEGFKAGMKRFGKTLGASATGVSIYELPPGQAICPYHYEYAEEEWLIVLEGTPTLRTA
jgi:predicted signal transduction protein with EAL and GGDEF domain